MYSTAFATKIMPLNDAHEKLWMILTSFMIVHNLMQFKPHRANIIDLICVFDIIANLVVKDASGLNDAI